VNGTSSFRGVLLLCVVVSSSFVLGGCGSEPVQIKESEVPAPSRMTEAEAKKLMLDAATKTRLVGGSNAPFANKTWSVTDLTVTGEGVFLKYTDSEYGTVRQDKISFAYPLTLTGKWDLNDLADLWMLGGNLTWYSKDDAVQFLTGYNAVKNLRLRKSAPVDENEIAAFKAGIAAQYHAASPKPQLPESARRYALQAMDATKDARYEDALAAFQKAFEVAPWWPEGHYNCALVYSALEEYGDAMTEMRKYLLLVPEAQNARVAQDKIYVWEGRQGGK